LAGFNRRTHCNREELRGITPNSLWDESDPTDEEIEAFLKMPLDQVTPELALRMIVCGVKLERESLGLPTEIIKFVNIPPHESSPANGISTDTLVRE
jgi:hypothetical protein